MVKKYNKYRTYGWYNESQRHSLARQGIKTGRKTPNYATDITTNGVVYEPTSIGTEAEVPKDEDIMKDVDTVVAESREERVVTPKPEIQIEPTRIKPESIFKEESPLAKEISSDISAIESEHEPLNALQGTWSEKLGGRIKGYLKSGLQAYRDTNVGGIDTHISNLEGEKTDIQDRVNLLQELKNKAMSKVYRDEVGVSRQLSQVKRINKLMAEPKGHLRTINNTILKLQKRRDALTRPKVPRKPGEPGEPQKGIRGAYVSIFPTFGEIMHPEKLKK